MATFKFIAGGGIERTLISLGRTGAMKNVMGALTDIISRKKPDSKEEKPGSKEEKPGSKEEKPDSKEEKPSSKGIDWGDFVKYFKKFGFTAVYDRNMAILITALFAAIARAKESSEQKDKDLYAAAAAVIRAQTGATIANAITKKGQPITLGQALLNGDGKAAHEILDNQRFKTALINIGVDGKLVTKFLNRVKKITPWRLSGSTKALGIVRDAFKAMTGEEYKISGETPQEVEDKGGIGKGPQQSQQLQQSQQPQQGPAPHKSSASSPDPQTTRQSRIEQGLSENDVNEALPCDESIVKNFFDCLMNGKKAKSLYEKFPDDKKSSHYFADFKKALDEMRKFYRDVTNGKKCTPKQNFLFLMEYVTNIRIDGGRNEYVNIIENIIKSVNNGRTIEYKANTGFKDTDDIIRRYNEIRAACEDMKWNPVVTDVDEVMKDLEKEGEIDKVRDALNMIFSKGVPGFMSADVKESYEVVDGNHRDSEASLGFKEFEKYYDDIMNWDMAYQKQYGSKHDLSAVLVERLETLSVIEEIVKTNEQERPRYAFVFEAMCQAARRGKGRKIDFDKAKSCGYERAKEIIEKYRDILGSPAYDAIKWKPLEAGSDKTSPKKLEELPELENDGSVAIQGPSIVAAASLLCNNDKQIIGFINKNESLSSLISPDKRSEVSRCAKELLSQCASGPKGEDRETNGLQRFLLAIEWVTKMGEGEVKENYKLGVYVVANILKENRRIKIFPSEIKGKNDRAKHIVDEYAKIFNNGAVAPKSSGKVPPPPSTPSTPPPPPTSPPPPPPPPLPPRNSK